MIDWKQLGEIYGESKFKRIGPDGYKMSIQHQIYLFAYATKRLPYEVEQMGIEEFMDYSRFFSGVNEGMAAWN